MCVCDLYVQKYMRSQVSHMEYLSTTLIKVYLIIAKYPKYLHSKVY